MKVLLLEDDAILSKEIQDFLTSQDIACETVHDGEAFIREMPKGGYDLMLLDINVPKINGLEVCKEVRKTDKQTPIMMITAYGDIRDKTEAFNMGADDYLVKPFHLQEMLLRIKALMRRKEPAKDAESIIHVGDLEINESLMQVKRAGEIIELTPKEYKLLVLLAKAKGRPLSKQTIAKQVWDIHFETSLNTIEVYINFLRKKIDKNFSHKLIYTRPGFGYYLKAQETAEA